MLATHINFGAFTHIAFGAAPGIGLIQVHIATVTRLRPDGTSWSDTFTFPDNYGGGVAKSGDGSPVVVTASKGLQVYDPSVFTPDAENYPEDYGRTPALDDSDQFTVDGSQLIGFTQDMRLWDLDWRFNGGGFFTPDFQIHGISVNQIGVAPAAPAAPTGRGRAIDASVTGDRPGDVSWSATRSRVPAGVTARRTAVRSSRPTSRPPHWVPRRSAGTGRTRSSTTWR